ncbi:MAG: hypothetical protein ACYCQI_01165 [Gammaproteobacteria bacterium]
MPTIKELKTAYAIARGKIVRTENLTEVSTQEKLYKLSVRTLYQAAVSSRDEKAEDLKEYEDFFYQLVADGAPCEVLVCAVSSNGSLLKKYCKDWKTNIDKALQFAIIEFLSADTGSPEKSIWHEIALQLFRFGANPNYNIENFADIKNSFLKDKWYFPTITPLQMLLSCKTFAKDSYDLCTAFVKFSEGRIENQAFVFALMDAVYDGKSYISDSWRYKSYENRHFQPLLKDERFKFIDETYPEHLGAYVRKPKSTFICSRVRTDYESLGYLMKKYNVYPFEIIFRNLNDLRYSKSSSLISLEQFKFFEKHFPLQLFSFIHEQEGGSYFFSSLYRNVCKNLEDIQSLIHICHKFKYAVLGTDFKHHTDVLSRLNAVYEEHLKLIKQYDEMYGTKRLESFVFQEDAPAYEKYQRIYSIPEAVINEFIKSSLKARFFMELSSINELEQKGSPTSKPSFSTGARIKYGKDDTMEAVRFWRQEPAQFIEEKRSQGKSVRVKV